MTMSRRPTPASTTPPTPARPTATPWSGTRTVWAAEPADELIDDGSVGLDRLLLIHEDDDGFYSSFYVEGKVDYDGDHGGLPRRRGRSPQLARRPSSISCRSRTRTAIRSRAKPTAAASSRRSSTTIETDDGTEVDLIEHVECQTLEDGESVVVFTLITSEDLYEDELDAALDVIDTLELDGGSASDELRRGRGHEHPVRR